MPPKFLENIVILCFERRFSKQNSVIRLKQCFSTPSPRKALDESAEGSGVCKH